MTGRHRQVRGAAASRAGGSPRSAPDRVGTVLGWLWALGSVAATATLVEAVQHDLDHPFPRSFPAVSALDEGSCTTA